MEWAMCRLGTDCADCGPRVYADSPPPPPSPPSPPPPDGWAVYCSNFCHAFKEDGFCDGESAPPFSPSLQPLHASPGLPPSARALASRGRFLSRSLARRWLVTPLLGTHPLLTLPLSFPLSPAPSFSKDGGESSEYSMCAHGTDCSDCGVRRVRSNYLASQCGDECAYALDGSCDDGGPGSKYSICDAGQDCGDCGDRIPGGERVPLLCGSSNSTCRFQADGTCDDGGEGASFEACPLGSDCLDCGVRAVQPAYFRQNPSLAESFLAPPPPPPLPSEWGCDNTCNLAFNDRCDDGGPGARGAYDNGQALQGQWSALFHLTKPTRTIDYPCALGTDCHDCGPRIIPPPPPPPKPPSPSPAPLPPPSQCTGMCRGQHANGAFFTIKERCYSRCPANNPVRGWKFGSFYFRTPSGQIHNCVCPNTRFPGNVQTNCGVSSEGTAAGFELCCDGVCHRSTNYRDKSPPPPPPPTPLPRRVWYSDHVCITSMFVRCSTCVDDWECNTGGNSGVCEQSSSGGECQPRGKGLGQSCAFNLHCEQGTKCGVISDCSFVPSNGFSCRKCMACNDHDRAGDKRICDRTARI